MKIDRALGVFWTCTNNETLEGACTEINCFDSWRHDLKSGQYLSRNSPQHHVDITKVIAYKSDNMYDEGENLVLSY
jgi:hypothetical protein